MIAYSMAAAAAMAGSALSAQTASSPAAGSSSGGAPKAAAGAPAYFWNEIFGKKKPASKFHLYKNGENPVVQELNASLRVQYQAGWADGHVGNYPGSRNWTSEFRRFRAGWNAKLFKDFKVQNVWNVGGVQSRGSWDSASGSWRNTSQTSASLYEAFVEYNHRQKGYTVAFGKTNPAVYAENRISSSSLWTPDFSISEQTVLFESAWGVWAANDTKKDKLGYYAGVWSTSSDGGRQTWGTWESCFTTLELSYGLDGLLLDKGRFYVDWVHNCADDSAVRRGDYYAGNTWKDVFAAYYIGRSGPFELSVEGMAALDAQEASGGADRMLAFTAIPTWMLTDRFQLVARFQCAHGENAVNVGKMRYAGRLQKSGTVDGVRYASVGRASDYWAVGAGVNFYVYPEDHARLKVMTMLEYANSGVSAKYRASNAGFTGWQRFAGVYMNF